MPAVGSFYEGLFVVAGVFNSKTIRVTQNRPLFYDILNGDYYYAYQVAETIRQ